MLQGNVEKQHNCTIMKRTAPQKVTLDTLARMVAAGFAETATKKDLESLRTELKGDIARLEGRVTGLEDRVTGLEGEIHNVEDRLSARIDGIALRIPVRSRD